MGVASCKWVRPILRTSWNSSRLLLQAPRCNPASAGISRRSMASSAARWMAVGMTSLLDWPRLTWSLGWTSLPPRLPPSNSMARLAMTSLAFMLVEVPEPVWKISSTNSASHFAVGDLLRGLDDGRGQVRLAVRPIPGWSARRAS